MGQSARPGLFERIHALVDLRRLASVGGKGAVGAEVAGQGAVGVGGLIIMLKILVEMVGLV